jgi:hypothetical protein
MTEHENKFYYQGKYFKKEEDFWAYVREWSNLETTTEEFLRLWENLGRDIWMNVAVRQKKLINLDTTNILESNFHRILGDFFNKQDYFKPYYHSDDEVK